MEYIDFIVPGEKAEFINNTKKFAKKTDARYTYIMRLRKTKNPSLSSPLFTLVLTLLREQKEIAEKGPVEKRKELASTTPLLDIQLILSKDKSAEVRRSLIQNPNLHSIVADVLRSGL